MGREGKSWAGKLCIEIMIMIMIMGQQDFRINKRTDLRRIKFNTTNTHSNTTKHRPGLEWGFEARRRGFMGHGGRLSSSLEGKARIIYKSWKPFVLYLFAVCRWRLYSFNTRYSHGARPWTFMNEAGARLWNRSVDAPSLRVVFEIARFPSNASPGISLSS